MFFKYLIKTFNLNENDILEITLPFEKPDGSFGAFNSLNIMLGKTSFSGITLSDLSLYFNQYGEFENWVGETYSISDTTKIKEKIKKTYNLNEKKNEAGITYLNLNSEEDIFMVYFEDSKIKFYCINRYYSLRNFDEK